MLQFTIHLHSAEKISIRTLKRVRKLSVSKQPTVHQTDGTDHKRTQQLDDALHTT